MRQKYKNSQVRILHKAKRDPIITHDEVGQNLAAR